MAVADIGDGLPQLETRCKETSSTWRFIRGSERWLYSYSVSRHSTWKWACVRPEPIGWERAARARIRAQAASWEGHSPARWRQPLLTSLATLSWYVRLELEKEALTNTFYMLCYRLFLFPRSSIGQAVNFRAPHNRDVVEKRR